MHTIEDAKRWADENAETLDRDRLACEDETIRMFNRMAPDQSRDLWNSGSWLGEQLRSHGASGEEISSIQMAQGQRAFGGDPWQAAVDYANEYERTGATKEKGGLELAKKRHEELFGR